MPDSLTLEETNKIRLANGLAPLVEDDGNQEPDQDTIAADNYSREQQRLADERSASATKARIDRAINQRELQAKKQGKGLGEAAEGGDDAASWAKSFKKGAKKRAAEVAARRKLEQDEADALAAATTYGEKDLRGLRVGHEADAFQEGDEHVLTLKDGRIEDGEDDELVNVNLAEHERTKERLDLLKKGKSGNKYTGYDDYEFDEFGKPKGVLSKYDEADDAPAGFTLGDDQVVASALPAQATGDAGMRTVDKALLSLDYVKNVEVSDYLQEGDAGFKKSKVSTAASATASGSYPLTVAEAHPAVQKKKRSGKRAAARDVEGDDDMAVGAAPVAQTSREELEAQALQDDEELQLALARARREKGRKRRQEVKVQPEESIVKAEEANQDDLFTEPGPTGGLVFDDTSEFVRNISNESSLAALIKPEPKPSRLRSESVVPPHPEQTNGLEEAPYMAEDDKPRVDVEMVVDEGDVKTEGIEEDIGTTGQEKMVGSSLTAALSVLNSQGLIKKLTPEQREREAKSREHAKWIAERRGDDRARLAAKAAAKAAGDSKDQSQREAENRARDLEYNRRQLEAMSNYKPDVQIKYTDEFGRDMNSKEAWKQMCHHFHGHGSGAAKTELRLKKIAEERQREAIASGDTPLNASFQARQERTGSATMILSVGNRGSAPMLEGDVGPNLRANPGPSKKTEKAARAQKSAEEGYNLTPMLSAPIASTSAESPAPVPRQAVGFQRVKAVSPAVREESPAQPSTPTASTSTIRIALGGKRKAEDEGDSPASKRKA